MTIGRLAGEHVSNPDAGVFRLLQTELLDLLRGGGDELVGVQLGLQRAVGGHKRQPGRDHRRGEFERAGRSRLDRDARGQRSLAHPRRHLVGREQQRRDGEAEDSLQTAMDIGHGLKQGTTWDAATLSCSPRRMEPRFAIFSFQATRMGLA